MAITMAKAKATWVTIGLRHYLVVLGCMKKRSGWVTNKEMSGELLKISSITSASMACLLLKFQASSVHKFFF